MTPEGINKLKQHEGVRNFVYWDSTGKPVGFQTGRGYATIGVGRNLVTRGLTVTEIDYLLDNDIAAITDMLAQEYPVNASSNGFAGLPPVWQDVAINETFNTGKIFPQMMGCMLAGDAQGAHDQLLNSKAAEESPNRYKDLAAAVLANSWGATEA